MKIFRRARRQFDKYQAAERMPFSGLVQRDAGQPWPKCLGTFAVPPLVILPVWLMLMIQEAQLA